MIWSLSRMSVGVIALMLLASQSPAVAELNADATVREFDEALQSEKQELVQHVLNRVHRIYRAKEDTAYKAECMERLYKTQNNSGTPEIFILLLDQLQNAREANPDAYKVADVIFGTIEHECG